MSYHIITEIVLCLQEKLDQILYVLWWIVTEDRGRDQANIYDLPFFWFTRFFFFLLKILVGKTKERIGKNKGQGMRERERGDKVFVGTCSIGNNQLGIRHFLTFFSKKKKDIFSRNTFL